MPKQRSLGVGLLNCCASPGGVGRCVYVSWCSCGGACAYGDLARRLPAGTRGVCCAGSGDCACCAYSCVDPALACAAAAALVNGTDAAMSLLLSGNLAAAQTVLGTAALGIPAVLMCMPARSLMHCAARRAVRRAVGAPDNSPLFDLCAVHFCGSCAFCQELNALDKAASPALRAQLAQAPSFEARLAPMVAPLARAASATVATAAPEPQAMGRALSPAPSARRALSPAPSSRRALSPAPSNASSKGRRSGAVSPAPRKRGGK